MARVFQEFLLSYRLPLILILNLGLTVLGYLLALSLRFDLNSSDILRPERLEVPLAFLLLYRSAAYTFWNLNGGYWRYSSTRDLMGILKSHAVSSVLFAATVFLLRLDSFPRSIIAIEFACSVLICGGSRLMVRMFCERFFAGPNTSAGSDTCQVVVLGAGDSGHMLVKDMLGAKRSKYQPIAVFDDSERLQNSNVHGVPVRGSLAALESYLVSNPNVSGAIVAIPSLSYGKIKELSDVCERIGVSLKRLQAFEDMAFADAYSSSNLNIESVLEKETDVEHEAEIRQALKGKRVLVTGAGGSIGSELVRQLIAFDPAEIVMFDHSEFNLFSLVQDLPSLRELNKSSTRMVPFLATICNVERVKRVFEQHKPEFVFHAAAYKHVPLMEEHCFEAFYNNVIGTRNIFEAAEKSGVERFVLVSTDKAVDPSSVMGCSKRLAEMLVAESGARSNTMGCSVVRFGNVINSAGSVIPLFKKQILSGGPLTVTHPKMERYFMSIREAVRLILTAGTLGDEGEIYVLDMGKPVKIVDLANKMLALYGRRDIPIVYTGVRSGEKLSEQLTCAYESTSTTRFSNVSKVDKFVGLEEAPIDAWVREAEKVLARISDEQIGSVMKSIVADADQIWGQEVSIRANENSTL